MNGHGGSGYDGTELDASMSRVELHLEQGSHYDAASQKQILKYTCPP